MRFFEKVHIWTIVSNHLKTLKNSNSGKSEFDDYLTFLVLPIFGASLLMYFNIKLSAGATNIIITTLSILVGLLFNVIVIIFDIIKRDSTKRLKNELLNQLLTNISYSIILSIFIIVITLLTFIDNCFSKIIFYWIVYFLLGNYFLTVLMIIKRMYSLFINELSEIEKEANKK